MQVLRGSSAIEVANTGYFMRQLSLGQNHHKDFLKLFNHTAGIAIISEDLPEEHNRIELDYENKDGGDGEEEGLSDDQSIDDQSDILPGGED